MYNKKMFLDVTSKKHHKYVNEFTDEDIKQSYNESLKKRYDANKNRKHSKSSRTNKGDIFSKLEIKEYRGCTDSNVAEDIAKLINLKQTKDVILQNLSTLIDRRTMTSFLIANRNKLLEIDIQDINLIYKKASLNKKFVTQLIEYACCLEEHYGINTDYFAYLLPNLISGNINSNTKNLIIINPTFLLVKYCLELYKSFNNTKIKLVIDDKHYYQFLSRINSYYGFEAIEFEHFALNINSEMDNDTSIVVIEDRHNKKDELLNIIEKLVALNNYENLNVQIINNDIYNKDVFNILKDNITNSLEVTLLPSSYNAERNLEDLYYHDGNILRKALINNFRSTLFSFSLSNTSDANRKNRLYEISYLSKGKNAYYDKKPMAPALDLSLTDLDKITFRELYRSHENNVNRKSNAKRKQATRIPFINSIDIIYTYSTNGTNRVSANFINNENNRKIFDFKVESKRKDINETLNDWLYYEFPFANKNDIDFILYLSQICKRNIKASNIDLNTLTYLSTTSSNKKLFILMAKYFRNFEFGSITYELIDEDYIDELIDNLPENITLKQFELFLRTIRYNARKFGLENICITKFLKTNSNKLENSVRSNFVESSFTPKEIKALYNTFSNNKDEIYKIASLIRLFTGLTPNVISALKWKDLVYTSYYNIDFYYFNITKQASNNGENVEFFNQRHKYRKIPLPKEISDLLIELKSKILVSNPDIDIENTNIFKIDDKAITPMWLYKKHNKEIKKLRGNRDNTLTIPIGESDFEEINLLNYAGDIFRMNFYYSAMDPEYFEKDEVYYIIGNKGDCTIENNYEDLKNIKCLLPIYLKLERFIKSWLN